MCGGKIKEQSRWPQPYIFINIACKAISGATAWARSGAKGGMPWSAALCFTEIQSFIQRLKNTVERKAFSGERPRRNSHFDSALFGLFFILLFRISDFSPESLQVVQTYS